MDIIFSNTAHNCTVQIMFLASFCGPHLGSTWLVGLDFDTCDRELRQYKSRAWSHISRKSMLKYSRIINQYFLRWKHSRSDYTQSDNIPSKIHLTRVFRVADSEWIPADLLFKQILLVEEKDDGDTMEQPAVAEVPEINHTFTQPDLKKEQMRIYP